MGQFIRINGVEYSTDFDFFMRNQVHVIKHLDNSTSFCSLLEKRCFRRDKIHSFDDETIMQNLNQIHRDIITLKYGGEIVY